MLILTVHPLPLHSKLRVHHTLRQKAYLERDQHDLQMPIPPHPHPGRMSPQPRIFSSLLDAMLIINRPASPSYSPSSYGPLYLVKFLDFRASTLFILKKLSWLIRPVYNPSTKFATSPAQYRYIFWLNYADESSLLPCFLADQSRCLQVKIPLFLTCFLSRDEGFPNQAILIHQNHVTWKRHFEELTLFHVVFVLILCLDSFFATF